MGRNVDVDRKHDRIVRLGRTSSIHTAIAGSAVNCRGNCLAQALMAINLSRSFAKPCDILCDLTIDDVAIPETVV